MNKKKYYPLYCDNIIIIMYVRHPLLIFIVIVITTIIFIPYPAHTKIIIFSKRDDGGHNKVIISSCIWNYLILGMQKVQGGGVLRSLAS